MKNVIIGMIVMLIVAAGIFFGTKVLSANNSDKVFKDFLTKSLQKTEFAITEELSGTGTEGSLKGVLKPNDKQILMSGELECKATVEDEKIGTNLQLQQENEKTFVKIKSFDGTLVADGYELDLSKVFTKTSNNWYEVMSDKGSEAQLNAGVFVSSAYIIAPNSNASSTPQDMLDQGVVVVKESRKDGDNFVYEVEANRKKYEDLLKANFPDLKNVDLVLDGVFDDDDTTSATLVITKDGELVSESYSATNPCYDFTMALLSTEPSGIAQKINSTQQIVNPSEVTIEKVKNPRPFEKIAEDVAN